MISWLNTSGEAMKLQATYGHECDYDIVSLRKRIPLHLARRSRAEEYIGVEKLDSRDGPEEA
jgi:hypothetical protein